MWGIGSSLSILGAFAVIALAAAFGAIIVVPVAAFAILAAIAWFLLFYAMGVDRAREEATAAGQELRVRSREQTAQELLVNWLGDRELPGGADGGDDSPSANRIVLPARDGTPWGDTDQHSSSARLPLAHH